jgi:ribosomal protein L12E/L44/L45/RPP1/RPP2
MGKPPSAAASQNKTGKAGAVARSNTSNMKERQQENEEEDGIDFFLTDLNKKP